MRLSGFALALLGASLLGPRSGIAQSTGVDAAAPKPVAHLSIERRGDTLVIRGSASSSAHPTLLREVVQQHADAPAGADLTIDLSIGPLTPPGWSLVTEMVLRAVLATRRASAVVTPTSIAIQGITPDEAGFAKAVRRIDAARLDGMRLSYRVIPMDRSTNHRELCVAQFATLTGATRIEFASSDATIGGDSYRALDALVELAAGCPNLRFDIVGHTDSSGNAEANRAISEARAQSVQSYLLARGVPSSRMRARGAGPADTRSAPNERRTRRASRRVEIRLLEP